MLYAPPEIMKCATVGPELHETHIHYISYTASTPQAAPRFHSVSFTLPLIYVPRQIVALDQSRTKDGRYIPAHEGINQSDWFALQKLATSSNVIIAQSVGSQLHSVKSLAGDRGIEERSAAVKHDRIVRSNKTSTPTCYLGYF